MSDGDQTGQPGPMDAPGDTAPEERIASPCVRLCVIHTEAQVCTGCLRTIEEITAWTRYNDAERRAIMAALPDRAPLLRQRRGGRSGRLARSGKTTG